MQSSAYRKAISSINEIGKDNVSGAAELMEKAGECLLEFLNSIENEKTFREEMINICKNLAGAQPSMAPIFNLANESLLFLEQFPSAECQSMLKNIQKRIEKTRKASEEIAKLGSSLIEDGMTIITHSRSSTILEIFKEAKEEDKNFEVVLTESRPIYEGRKLARELTSLKIDVVLVIDSAIFGMMEVADLAIIGADSITRNGVVNKVGTSGMASFAQGKIPLYVACSMNKIFPSSKKIERKERNAGEIWNERDIEVKNIYFDKTPLESITKFITEEGLLAPAMMIEKMEKMRVSKFL